MTLIATNHFEDPTISSDLINQIQAKYKASLKDKLITLETLWVESDAKSEGKFDQLLTFLHQFAGSAGMYGYDQISTQCVELQSVIKNSGGSDEIQKSYNQLIQMIDQSIDA